MVKGDFGEATCRMQLHRLVLHWHNDPPCVHRGVSRVVFGQGLELCSGVGSATNTNANIAINIENNNCVNDVNDNIDDIVNNNINNRPLLGTPQETQRHQNVPHRY